MDKIIIIGSPGSGKTYLSNIMSKKLHMPVYHLDGIFWNKDKTHISRDLFDEKLNAILSLDKWIIDGDYSRTYEIRMDKSDTIIFLNLPLDVCLNSVQSRIGTVREDLPWVENEFDPEFKKWIIDWHKSTYQQLTNLLDKYKSSKNIMVFNSRDEINEYIKSL